MKTINIHEAKSRLSGVQAEIETKQEKYKICRNGKPIADLVPHRQSSRTTPHPEMGKIKINYDPVEELSGDEWGEVD